MGKKVFCLVLIALFFQNANSQCTLYANAVPGLTLTHVSTNCSNNSGVAYNPILGLYYGVRAGNTGFPLETWDAAGNPLYQTTAGFDWRGMWWNPALNQLEGNGYNTYGMWNTNLNGSGYALNTGANIFTGMNQPNSQSCGDLDYDANEVLYYYNGMIYRRSRATNASLGSYAITGTPVAIGNLNWTTLMYTGCPGMEIALLDYVNRRVYLYDKSTGAYAGMSQLPGTAVTNNGFRTSWANGYVWLFNLGDRTWYSYRIFDIPLPVEMVMFDAEYEGDKVKLTWETSSETNNDYFIIERSLDGMTYDEIGRIDGAGNSNIANNYLEYDNKPVPGLIYYRLKQVDFDGTTNIVDVQTVTVTTDDDIVIYPNPAPANNDVINCQGDANKYGTYSITNGDGSYIVKDQQFTGKIDISTLSAGVYYITFMGQDNRQIKRLIIH